MHNVHVRITKWIEMKDNLRNSMMPKTISQNRLTQIQMKECWQIDFEIQSAVATLSQWEQTWIGNWSRVNFSLCKCTNCQVKNVTTFCFLGVIKKTGSHWRHLGQISRFQKKNNLKAGITCITCITCIYLCDIYYLYICFVTVVWYVLFSLVSLVWWAWLVS